MVIFYNDIRRYQVKAILVYWFYLPLLILGSGRIIDLAVGLPACRFLTAGISLITAGGLIIHRATLDLSRYGKGTPSPFRPCRVLVTEGMYGFCRHPMWLGYDLMALGIILMLGSTGALLVSFPVFVGAQVIFLRKEEMVLKARFKQNYTNYRARTGMFFTLRLSNPEKGDNR